MLIMYKGEVLEEPGNVDFGDEDISGIGDGTVTGAIKALDSKVPETTVTVLNLNTCSSAKEIAERMLANPDKVGHGSCGAMEADAIKGVVGTPSGYGNYVSAYFEAVSPVLIRATALNRFATSRPKTGYVWNNDTGWVWSGWD